MLSGPRTPLSLILNFRSEARLMKGEVRKFRKLSTLVLSNVYIINSEELKTRQDKLQSGTCLTPSCKKMPHNSFYFSSVMKPSTKHVSVLFTKRKPFCRDYYGKLHPKSDQQKHVRKKKGSCAVKRKATRAMDE